MGLGSSPEGHKAHDISYSVPDEPWAEEYGLHRAVVTVPAAAGAITVCLPWRRRDSPEAKCIIVTDEKDQRVANIFRVSVSSERATLVFGPVADTGTFYIYYLPFPVQTGAGGGYWKDYLPPESAPDPAWVDAHGLKVNRSPAPFPDVVIAVLISFEARTAFDSFFPMELPITALEKRNLLTNNVGASCLLFPEDRRYPIRMPEALPLRWLQAPQNHFAGEALRNEYYTFQIGVYAAAGVLQNVSVSFSDLTNADAILPSTVLTCFNTGGIDCYGKPFSKRVDIPIDTVQALWIGVDIPEEARPGVYSGTVAIAADGLTPMPVAIELKITEDMLKDRGDSELWRHSRLRWLNSTAGTADTPVEPYTPIERDGERVACLGRSVQVADSALPTQIHSFGCDILAAPIQFVMNTQTGRLKMPTHPVRFTHESEGSVAWESHVSSDLLDIDCRASMEFDGYLHYDLALTAKQDLSFTDTRLELPFLPHVATHMMGMGVTGGLCPDAHDWKWEGPQDSFWIGNAQGGLHCELRGSTYHGPLLNRVKPPPPPTWSNAGQGGLRVERTENCVTVQAHTGAWTLKAGQPINFEFALTITPVKPLNPKRQFTDRYYHKARDPEPADEHLAAGVKVVNIHHGNRFNPYINYPFLPDATERMKAFVKDGHRRGFKTKIYYTLRELTNHLHELWALRSLGHEVLADGDGGGYPWLREHLCDGYFPRWYHHFGEDGRVCAAIANSGESRWYNYYIESLGWLLKNIDIDGLYLDDVSYDRRILKRMRRVMAEVKPDCLIDLHSNTGFSIGPATQYTEFFPYIDKLWFGEGFKYDEMTPDQWLVEVSGIPFGHMGDMLHGGGNRWLGMVYGMTARMPWTDAADPRPVWQVWDEFGIAEARMVGYWDPDCPVHADHPDVKVTAYIKDGRALLAIGSWARETTKVNLTIDWDALGLAPDTTALHAPAIKEFQDACTWSPDDPIHVLPLRGWLICLDKRQV
ncbi:MAG: hypothetical protein HN341_00465 [Verrucomicrobia bacterium]|nr:hypothetical protein [Verrucomicrobiota bacterium]